MKIYRYYSDHNYPVRVSIAGHYDETAKRLNLAAARCSEEDRFVRKVGRELAEKRLSENKIIASVYLPSMNAKDFIFIAQFFAVRIIIEGLK